MAAATWLAGRPRGLRAPEACGSARPRASESRRPSTPGINHGRSRVSASGRRSPREPAGTTRPAGDGPARERACGTSGIRARFVTGVADGSAGA
jgi:hypothetical protein